MRASEALYNPALSFPEGREPRPAKYLPASRVTVIGADGRRRPWRPPEPPDPFLSRVRPAAPAPAAAPKNAGAANGRARAVVCLRPDGSTARYPTIVEAARAEGVTETAVRKCCARRYVRSDSGRLFRFEGDPMPERAATRSHSRLSIAVVVRSPEGEERRFPSLGAAAKASGVSQPTLSNMLTGKCRSHKSAFTIRYAGGE